ncbi:MAG: sulfotransferase family protein, partial [Solirubrobacterales bacterium]
MSRADSPLAGRMIFAVGARRSGTYWLQRVLTDHPQIAGVPSESHLFSHGVAPLFERLQHSTRSSPQVGKVYVERDVALDAARDLCDAVLGGFAAAGTRYVCERTPVHALHLELIAAIYPDARFLHIIRDGRDVARSLAVQDFGPEDIPAAAAEWRAAVEAARGAALPAEIYREVRYEQLLSEPERLLGDVYGWLGLEASPEVLRSAVTESETKLNVDQASQHRIATEKWRREFRREDLEGFNRVAGELLSELGYRAADPAELPRRPAARRPTPGPRLAGV